MDKYIFREYSPDYPKYFKQEKKRLDAVFDGAAEMQHVGSTAIPGLGGKGIIDIVIGVSDVLFEKAKGMLEQAGYEYREAASCDDRLFFRRKYGYSNEKRFVHIHLLRHGKQTWVEMIGLRDYLSRNQQVLTVQKYFKD